MKRKVKCLFSSLFFFFSFIHFFFFLFPFQLACSDGCVSDIVMDFLNNDRSEIAKRRYFTDNSAFVGVSCSFCSEVCGFYFVRKVFFDFLELLKSLNKKIS